MATRKQITFDLDTKKLRENYNKGDWHHAYDDIKKFMLSNGFSWRQGSTYISNQPLEYRQVSKKIDRLIKQEEWIYESMRDCTMASIGKSFSLNSKFKNAIDVEKVPNIAIEVEEDIEF